MTAGASSPRSTTVRALPSASETEERYGARWGGPEPTLAVTFPQIPGRTEHLTIPAGPGHAPCTVYYPPGEPDGEPAVHVNFHGGGFVIGHPEQDDPLCRYLAANAGVVVVNVDDLLAPQHPFPAPSRQAYEVVRWVAGSGAEHGWDGTRLSVGGQSAGGNLAAAVARQSVAGRVHAFRSAESSSGPGTLRSAMWFPLRCLDRGRDRVPEAHW